MIRVVVAVLLVATPAFAAERAFPVGAFDRLAVEGSPNVAVTTGRAPGVHASGSADALDKLDIRVEGGTLRIGTKRGVSWSWRDSGGVRVAVTVPMLRGVDVSGSSDVNVDRVKAPDFAANTSGSGSVRVAALDVDRASFATSGSGGMEAAGRCGAGTVKVAGSGDMKLGALRCETLSASVAGSGSVDAFATRTATLATMGSGDITVAGGARCAVSTAGSGTARCS